MRKIGTIGLFNHAFIVGGGGDGKPDIESIDLTAETLDSRVKYVGPEHAYRDSLGLISYSAENTWPLEYVNYVAVGRHEPEKEATNYSVDNVNMADLTSGLGDNSSGWTFSPGSANITRSDSSLSPGVMAAMIPTSMPNGGVYSEATKSWLYNPDLMPYGPTWERVSMAFNTTAAGKVRLYVGRGSSTMYCYNRTTDTGVGAHVASYFRKAIYGGPSSSPVTYLPAALIQVEAGSVLTSPIRNNAISSPATRAASSVVITEKRAKTARVVFSDGHAYEIDSTNGVFTLPTSTADWGKRYIKQIKFEAK